MNQTPNFSFEELVEQHKFREWVFSEKEQHQAYWQQWLAQHPEQKNLLEEAAAFVLRWEMPKKALPQNVIETEWEKLQHQLHQPKVIKINRLRWIRYAAAAAVIGIIGLGGLWYWNAVLKWETYQTNYAEIENITLPDGSKVALNANSTLKLTKNWHNAQKREVWLNGEAYFSVTKKDEQQFIVHANELDVEVLGTEFDVISRNHKTRVVLTEGKIKINFKETETIEENAQKSKREAIILQPNELLESEPQNYVKKTVETAVYESWKDNILTFDNTPITELTRIFKDNYGVNVVLGKGFNEEDKISGTFPINKLDILLETLVESLNIKVIPLEANTYKFEKIVE